MVIFSFCLISIFISRRAFASPHLLTYSIIYVTMDSWVIFYYLLSLFSPVCSLFVHPVFLPLPLPLSSFIFLTIISLAEEARLFVQWGFPPLALAEHVPEASVNTLHCPLGLLLTGGSPRGLIGCWFDIFGEPIS